jgi:ssDNA-binding Zn-finger/Zn-ribbon topoisomerase 1
VSKRAITCPNCGAPIGDADVSKEGGGDYGDDDYPESEYEEYIS